MGVVSEKQAQPQIPSVFIYARGGLRRVLFVLFLTALFLLSPVVCVLAAIGWLCEQLGVPEP